MSGKNPANDILLLRNSFWRRDELQSEVFGSASERSEGPFFELLFVLLLADIDIVLAVFEHPIYKEGEFMGGGGKSFGFSEARADTATKRSQCAVAVEQSLGAHT